jgi:hypothetical protein
MKKPRCCGARASHRRADDSNLGSNPPPQPAAPGIGGGRTEEGQRTWYRILIGLQTGRRYCTIRTLKLRSLSVDGTETNAKFINVYA